MSRKPDIYILMLFIHTYTLSFSLFHISTSSYSFVNVNESESDIVGQKEAAINLLLRQVHIMSF